MAVFDARADGRGGRLGVFGDVRQCLGDQVVGGRLDAGRQALVGQLADVDRYVRAAGQRVERRAEAALGEDRGMDAARELS